MTSDEGKEWLNGLRDIPSKSARDTLEVWKEIVDDVNKRNEKKAKRKNNGKDAKVGAGTKLMRTIGHTMSDKARTEVLFNTLIEAYINEILPALKEAEAEEEDLDDDERAIVVRLNNFFCGLHSLVHYAEVADKTALAIEENHYGAKENIPILIPAFRQAGESGAARTVRQLV